jgi:hypothetical protein
MGQQAATLSFLRGVSTREEPVAARAHLSLKSYVPNVLQRFFRKLRRPAKHA